MATEIDWNDKIFKSLDSQSNSPRTISFTTRVKTVLGEMEKKKRLGWTRADFANALGEILGIFRETNPEMDKVLDKNKEKIG